jgi:hypothetical protein
MEEKWLSRSNHFGSLLKKKPKLSWKVMCELGLPPSIQAMIREVSARLCFSYIGDILSLMNEFIIV